MPQERSVESLTRLYLTRCEVEGKSPLTVKAYAFTLRRFHEVLVDLGAPTHDIALITREHIYGYLSQFTDRAETTRHRYFRDIRCFFAWLIDSGYLEQTPFRGLKNIRLPHRIVQPFTPEQISILLAACAPGPIGTRDRAFILTLLDTGLRCSEATRLELMDLDLEAGRIRVRFGKGNKQRIVPFAGRCRAVLLEYLMLRGYAPGPLFVASNGHGRLVPDVGLQPNGLKQMLRRLGRRTGVSKVHAHRFRHTFATWAIQHDARELDVQYLLGHSSPDMVRRYSSSYRSEQAALRHERFSPADQMFPEAS